MDMKYLVLCDIDDSLFRSNTTFDFLEYAARNDGVLRTWLRIYTRRWSPVFLFLTALGAVIRRDVVRERGIRLLAGMEKKRIQTLAFAFYDEWLAPRINTEVETLLNRHPESGRYLVSSTLEPVAMAIASRLGVDFRASQLEEVNGRLTGRMTLDLTGEKHAIAVALREQNPSARLIVITDNRSDRKLVEMAEERFVIVHSESDRLFWSDLHPSYIHA